MYKFYIPNTGNDNATAFYIKVIQKAVLSNGGKVAYTSDLDEIYTDDIVIVIHPYHFLQVYMKRPKKIISWIQGVTPEECWMTTKNPFSRIIKYILYSIEEKLLLKNSSLIFFVSEQMHQHYKKKYGYNKNNYFIMPCFNQYLNIDAFNNDKYSVPKFVYSGSLAKWQCFEETVILFKMIREEIKDATFTIYTSERELAKTILEKYGIEAELKYVPYNQMADEMKVYKYGFLIREDVVVNRVATPTKMNSYLANGIIPIYSNVIGAFAKEFKGKKFFIPMNNNIDGSIGKLVALESSLIEASDVLSEYQEIFSQYYSEPYYINEIVNIFKMHLK